MTSPQNQGGMRYTPCTLPAQQAVDLLTAYEDAYKVAHSVWVALGNWSKDLVGVQPGDVVETGKRIKTSACVTPVMDMRGTFTGWKGHKPRMLVESVTAATNTALSASPQMAVLLQGVPLKDDGTPFKSATCSATIYVMEQALDFDFRAESGYTGYLKDALSRFVDEAASSRNNQA